MTEKRFNDKKFHLNKDFCIVKNDNRIGYDLEDTVDLLNQYYYLYELCSYELKEIKEENKRLKQREQVLLDEIEDFQELLTKLDNENKKLKQEIKKDGDIPEFKIDMNKVNIERGI